MKTCINFDMKDAGPCISHVTSVASPCGSIVNSAVLWPSNGLMKSSLMTIFEGAGPSRHTAGYAIVKLISREPAGQRGLNDPNVQQWIRQQLRTAHAQLLRSAYLEMVRDEAKVRNYYAEQVLKEGAQ